jgi:hypothetical protein
MNEWDVIINLFEHPSFYAFMAIFGNLVWTALSPYIAGYTRLQVRVAWNNLSASDQATANGNGKNELWIYNQAMSTIYGYFKTYLLF